jgi:DNA primase
VIVLPENLDPADVISRNPQEFGELIKNSLSILEFYFQNTFSRFDKKTPEGKKNISKILLPVIKRIPNKIEQSFWVQKLAKELEVKEENVIEELKKVKSEEDIYGLEPEEITNLPPKSRRELLEEKLLTLILKKPENISLVGQNKSSCFLPKSQSIFDNLKKDKESQFKNCPPETLEYLNYLSLKSEIEEIDEKDILEETSFCLREIQSLEIKNKLNELSRDIKRAEEEKKYLEIEKLIREFDLYSKELQDLDNIK